MSLTKVAGKNDLEFVHKFWISLTICLFLRLQDSATLGLDVPCPSNNTNVSLIYSFHPGIVENTREDNELPKTITDLKGFCANMISDFFAKCPMQYSLMRVNFSLQLDTAITLNKSFLILIQRPQSYFSLFHLTQPVLILPTCIVYFGKISTTVSPTIILRYGLKYMDIICSVIGAIVFLFIERWEIKVRQKRNYTDVLWKFLLSPFGICDESLMKTLSMKIFTFTWLSVWLLLFGFFWAEMSSNMTVSKLNDDVDTLEDVLASKRHFFWLSDIHNSAPKMLQEKYENFAGETHRNYEKLGFTKDLKSITMKMLHENQILLTWCVDLQSH